MIRARIKKNQTDDLFRFAVVDVQVPEYYLRRFSKFPLLSNIDKMPDDKITAYVKIQSIYQ